MRILNLKMPLGEALAVSAIGIITVMIILTVIAMLIILLSKAVRTIEYKTAKSSDNSEPLISAEVPTQRMSQGQIELIDTDEKTAAVIMAVVANKTGMPLERLSFKSIRLINEERGKEK